MRPLKISLEFQSSNCVYFQCIYENKENATHFPRDSTVSVKGETLKKVVPDFCVFRELFVCLRSSSVFFLMRPISRNFSLFGQNLHHVGSVVRGNGTSPKLLRGGFELIVLIHPDRGGGCSNLSIFPPPPLNDEISEFVSGGFNIFQISQNVRLGVLIFSMLCRFWTIFPCKTAFKKPTIFSRASRANFSPGF